MTFDCEICDKEVPIEDIFETFDDMGNPVQCCEDCYIDMITDDGPIAWD